MARTPLAGTGSAARVTRGVLWTALAIAVLVLLAVAVSAVVSAVETVRTGVVHTSLEMRGSLPTEADAGPADLRSGAYRTAEVAVGELSGGIVALHVVRIALDASVGMALAGTVAILARRLLRPDPLARRLSLVVTLAGGTVRSRLCCRSPRARAWPGWSATRSTTPPTGSTASGPWSRRSTRRPSRSASP